MNRASLLIHCGLVIIGLWTQTALGQPSPPAFYYVAPNGSANGDGSKEKPWDLQTAINLGSPVKPGDTIWMRGGTYLGNYSSWLTGTSNQVITLRAYRNEFVSIDGYPNPSLFPLNIQGAWAEYRNFEVTQSSTWNSGAPTPVGIQCTAPNVKIINVTVHDAGQGIGFWSGATNSEVYGCILYHNGLDSQEHGLYTQNEGGTKRIHDNIIFNNSGFGVHAYTTASQVRGFDFEGNIAFNSGAKFPADRYPNLFIGGFPPSDRITVISNYTFTSPGVPHYNILLSDRDHSSNPNGSLVFRGNYVVGGSQFTADDYLTTTFSNNFLVTSAGRMVRTRAAPGVPLSAYRWDANTYYGPGAAANVFAIADQNYSFANWQAASSLDSNSTYHVGFPAITDVIVRPNRYEPGRAHVVVYNWENLDSIPVNLSTVGLLHGQLYEIRNVQNYVRNGLNEFGAPVEAGAFDTNNPIITIHLKTPEARAVADPGFPGSYVPPTTLPQFGVFVIAPPSDGVPIVITRPLSHWKFDEPSGLNALDVAGTNTGTLVGGPTRVAGKLGGGLHFDGVDDHVNIPSNSSIDLGNRMSISLWFKPSQLLNASSGRKDLLKRFTAYWLILNYPYADGRIAFVLNGGSPSVYTTTASWLPNQWYHLTATCDGVNMKIYVNGVLEGTTSANVAPAHSGYPLQIGGNSEQGFFFPGTMDEVRLYNTGLPPAEVLNLYRKTSQANTPPTISPLPDQTTPEDMPTAPITFTIYDPETETDELHYSARSSNTVLIPNNNIVFGGTGTNRTLTITPALNQSGNASITIGVIDPDGEETESTFVITVTPLNDSPSISALENQIIVHGFGSAGFTFTIGDPETSAPNLEVEVSSSNQTVVPNDSLSLSGNDSSRTLTVTPITNVAGSTLISLLVTDEQGATAQTAFILTVTLSNVPPAITAISAQVIDEDSPSPPLPFRVEDIETPAPNLNIIGSSSDQTLVPDSGIHIGGFGSDRTVVVTPLPNETGDAVITLIVRDSHNGTASNSFSLTVNSVNDRPTITAIPDQIINRNASSAILPVTIGDVETDASALSLTMVSSNPNLAGDANIVLGGTGSNRTIRVTPSSNQLGTAVITLTASDGNLSTNTSFVLQVHDPTGIPANLVSHWRLDESFGTTVFDATERNLGVLINNPTRVSGKIGGALSFNGINNYVNVPDSDSLDLGSTLTISLWFRPAQTLNAATGRRDLFKKFISYWLIMNYPSNDGKLAFVLNSGAPVVKTTTTEWLANQWYHIAATYDGSTMRLYVNGALQAATPASVAITKTTSPVQFGGNSEQGFFFPGVIDEVRLYNNALFTAEILDLYNSSNIPEVTPPPPGLTSFWKLDEPAGTIALDAAGTNAGTLLNGPTRVTGRFGGALSFDGINDSVSIPDSDHLDLTNSMSISLWFKPTRQLDSTTGRTALLTKFVSYWLLQNYPRADGTLTFVLNSGFPAVSSITSSWKPDQWYHVATTYDGSFLRLYINGVLENSVASTAALTQSAFPLQIGGDSMQGLFFSGVIDEVQLYGRALFSQEVQNLFQNSTRPNTPPALSDIADQSLEEDQITPPLAFTVSDTETLAENLRLSGHSSNQTLVPDSNIRFGGIGIDRTVVISPATNQSGSATITITVTDDSGSSVSDTFLLAVSSVNDPPAISDIPNQTAPKDQPTDLLPFSINDSETALASLTLTADSSDPALLSPASINFGGSGSVRTVRITPVTGQTGVVTLTITVSDGTLSVSNSFQLAVQDIVPPPPGLISQWTFDEGAGSSAFDLVGGFTGTLMNDPVRAPGRLGSALVLDGVNDYVNIPDADPLDLTDKMSISLWFKPARLLDATTGRKDVFKKFISYWLIMNYPPADGKLSFALNNGFPFIKSGISSWEPDQWYHVVATYDGASMKLYLNGTLDGSAPANAAVAKTGFPVQIGGNTEQGHFFPGSIDDVRLYGRPLTSNEVAGLFITGAGGGSALPESGLQLLVDGSRAVLSWNAVPGRIYRVQYRSNLAAGEWQDLPSDVPATSARASKEDSLAGVVQRFYRIVTP